MAIPWPLSSLVKAIQLLSRAAMSRTRAMCSPPTKPHGMSVSRKVMSRCIDLIIMVLLTAHLPSTCTSSSYLDYELVKSSEIMSQSFHILQTVNDVTYKRMKMAARELEKMEQLVGTSSCEKLMRMIFCDDVQPSLPITNIDYNKLKIDAKHLNAAQQNVIMECVRHPELFCIHGNLIMFKCTTYICWCLGTFKYIN